MFARKPSDQIHIDDRKPNASRKRKRPLYVVGRMCSADPAKRIIIHALWVNGDALHAMFAQNKQFILRDRIRPPRLNRNLITERTITDLQC